MIEEFKSRQRDRLAGSVQAAGASQPDLLADALFLLIEGARVSRRSVGAEGPSASLVRMCEAIVELFGGNRLEREAPRRSRPGVDDNGSALPAIGAAL